MPAIIDHGQFCSYVGPSGVELRFPKDDAEILASIRASDPEAATVVQYLPAECSLVALKDQMIEADRFDAIDKLAAGWPARVRVQWLNGQTIKANDALYQAIIAGGIEPDLMRSMMVEAEKDE